MKQLKLPALIALTFSSFAIMSYREAPQPSTSVVKQMIAKVLWATDSHDFGEIPQGKPVSTEFSFKNDGNEPLIITDVATSCGCTASDYSKEPIAPGKSSLVKVTYNASNMGAFTKTITVNFSDVTAKKILNIKGTVK